MSKSPEGFTFTVGKLDAGMAILIGEKAHLIEFPSLLLPPGAGAGSIVNISVHQNFAEEERQRNEFWQLQNEIYKTFGVASPQNPKLEIRNVTQTSVTLEWPQLELATAKLRSLDLYKNGQRLAMIPSPHQNTSTKVSGLELHTDYNFQLILKTTAGTYPSNLVRVRTHTINNTSGISVCFGNVEDTALLKAAKAALNEMHAKGSDKIQIDTTHFVCSTPAAAPNGPQQSNSGNAMGVEYQRALQLSIPIVQPQWILACNAEQKMVPISGYYLGATPPPPTQASRPMSVQQPPPSSSAPPDQQPSLSPSSPSPTSAASRASAFVNQTETESDQDPPRPSQDTETSGRHKSRQRNGTMNKNFKFPLASPPAGPPPETVLPAENQNDTESPKPVGYDVTPQEVPPPPPVEKPQTQQPQVHDEDGEDDVGPTVEVDLS